MTARGAGLRAESIWRPYVAVAVALGIYAWAMFAMESVRDGLIGPIYGGYGTDFMVYHTAARLYFEGNLPLLGNFAALTERLNRDFATVLTAPLALQPWVYPPIFLLVLLPLGLLPFWLAYCVFVVSSFVGCVAAFRLFWSSDLAAGRVWTRALALAPGTAVTALCGQNALLTTAILAGGLGLLDRGALVAGGALLALLGYKPQFALLVPVLLIGRKAWRALAASVVGGLAYVMASCAILGLGVWRDWLHWLAGGGGYDAWRDQARTAGYSLYTCVRLLGGSPAAGNAAQLAAFVIAAWFVLRASRPNVAPDLRLSTLLVASFLAAPHSSQYDCTLLACAAVPVLLRAAQRPKPVVPPMICLTLWASAVLGPPRITPTGYLVPLAALVFLVLLARRGESLGNPAASAIRPQHRCE